MVVASDTAASSSEVSYGMIWLPPARPIAMFDAALATERPMIMITGPITTGGSRRLTIAMPRQRTMAANTKYMKPAQNRPNMVAPCPQVCIE
ncbi:hypothetical protein D3C78_1788590 [compost metagenome]